MLINRIALLLACLIAIGEFASVANAAQPPNLVFFLADDLRYDAIGANGNPIVQTPNIDLLAEKSVCFERAFVTTSICMTSRACIMTGQHAGRHGVTSFGQRLSPAQLEATYFGQLKEAGYSLGFVGKWGVGSPPQDLFDFNAGYDGQGAYYPTRERTGKHLTQRMGEQAVEYVSQQGGDRPFCLSVSFKAPHVGERPEPEWQFNYDRRYEELYNDVEIPQPRLSDEAFFNSQPAALRESENRIRWRQRFETPELYQRSVKSYYRLITGLDRVVGEVLDQLEELGLADNTVVIFTSDHGFYLGERGFAGKWYPHELSIQVPLIIYDPRQRVDESRDADAMALSIDIAPTLLDYAGVPVPQQMQGRSLKPVAEGSTPSDWRNEFYYEHAFDYGTIPKSEAIRTDRFKYIVYPELSPPVEELYDLSADQDEAFNLAGEEAWHPTLERLRQRLVSLRQQAHSRRIATNR